MKNQECSKLTKTYNKYVVLYNDCVKRIVQNKFEMSYLWKYKKDYPADWKRKAEMLSDDRSQLNTIMCEIIALKFKIRRSNSEYNKK